jgi:hypothetical protein
MLPLFPARRLRACLFGFYCLSTEKSRSNKTNRVALTAGFAKASRRTGRLEEAPREVLPAASHIMPESFSETRHIVVEKLHANATVSADLDSERIGIDKKKKNSRCCPDRAKQG